jgi:hypothetical protein
VFNVRRPRRRVFRRRIQLPRGMTKTTLPARKPLDSKPLSSIHMTFPRSRYRQSNNRFSTWSNPVTMSFSLVLLVSSGLLPICMSSTESLRRDRQICSPQGDNQSTETRLTIKTIETWFFISGAVFIGCHGFNWYCRSQHWWHDGPFFRWHQVRKRARRETRRSDQVVRTPQRALAKDKNFNN